MICRKLDCPASLAYDSSSITCIAHIYVRGRDKNNIGSAASRVRIVGTRPIIDISAITILFTDLLQLSFAIWRQKHHVDFDKH